MLVDIYYISSLIDTHGANKNFMANYNNGSREGLPHTVMTPRSEFVSHSVYYPCNLDQNLDNVFSPSSIDRPTSFDRPPGDHA